jgi:eukaryotic-like serine/threonine-protein kinase
MTPNARWLQIKELFGQYQQQPDARREAWLAAQCADDEALLAEVRSLLSAQRAKPGIFGDGAVGMLKNLRDDEQAADRAVDLVGRRIGSYRLLRLIGEGGMGSVFLAERKNGDFVQQVALKLVRADAVSAETRIRFTREHNFLARLVHPNIAQLHDGGVAEDTPYFTLEYVEGEPITKYCDAHRLDIHQRLQLALQVCSAVTYAHRNLIVHRDLKPSNILVTAGGEAKLLDFGIAKLLDAESAKDQTVTQARMMTPEYAAPEQVLGEPITTATDVYAIGVLVYELVCGRMPYARADAGTISWAKAVVEEPPESFNRALSRTTGRAIGITGDALAATRSTTLPALRRSLRGDLDRIVQRALAKEPDARYPSVSALADDLRAFVDGRAISGGSRRYRLRKFVRLHWLPLAATAMILFILLISGAAIVWQSRQTAREAQNTLQVKDFLYGLFTAVDPRAAKGREVTARELLDRGAQRIERNHALDGEQRAEIESLLGRIYWQIGLFDQANTLQEGAIKALTADPAHVLLLTQTLAERADTLTDLGELKTAAALADEAKGSVDALPDVSSVDRARILHVQARVALNQRDFAAAKRHSDAELALVREGDVDPDTLFRALAAAGGASWGLSRFDEAEAYFRQALALASDQAAAPDDLNVAMALTNVAMTLQSKSHYAEAEELELQAVATFDKMLGTDHPLSMGVRRDLSLSYYRLGRYAQARELMEQVLAAQRKKLGDTHPAVAGTEINLGALLVEVGEADAAEPILTEAVSIFEKKYGRDFQGVRIALGDLGAAHLAQGKLDQAETELIELLDREKKNGVPGVGDLAGNYRLGDVRRLRGDYESAIRLQRAALAESEKTNGENSRFTAMGHQYLALSLRDRGDAEGAEREFRAALAAYAGYIPNAEHPLAATTRYELGLLLIQHEQTRAEGLRLLARAVELREKFLGADKPRTRQARDALQKAQRVARS